MTRAALIVGAILAAIASSFLAGWNYGRADMRADVADAYAKTIEDYNNADLPADADGIRHALCVLAGRDDCGDLRGQ